MLARRIVSEVMIEDLAVMWSGVRCQLNDRRDIRIFSRLQGVLCGGLMYTNHEYNICISLLHLVTTSTDFHVPDNLPQRILIFYIDCFST